MEPIAVYALDEGSGSTASDSSGNGNTGTLLNGPLWTAGKIGNAVSFDGVNDSVMVANNSALMPSWSLTLAAWFNANPQQAPFATLIGKTSSGGYWLGIDRDGADGGVANALCGELAVGGVWKIIHSQAIVYSAWNHVALTYDGSAARLYLNGVQVDSAPLTGTVGDTTQPLCIGMDPNGGTCSSGPFKGIIDEVKIYNRALSGAEVFTLASPGAPDTTLPSVSLTVPASGAAVSGTAVTVSANATDNVAVAGVQFKLDGANLGSEDTTSPYSITWNSTSTANGSHTLSAVARDSSANKTTAASVTVNVSNGLVVPDTAPPQVSFIFPLYGAGVQKYHKMNINAAATDNIKVSKVEFYVDGVLKGTDTVPDSHSVYKYVWRVPAPIGVTYRLQVIAYDTSNNSSSGAISVTSR